MASATPPDRLRELLRSEPLPCALVDVAAFDGNLASLLNVVAHARASPPALRLATKSVRCVPLLRRALARGGDRVRGLMTYAASETAFLARHGLDDLLLAYPTCSAADLEIVASLAGAGTRVNATVDDPVQLAALGAAAERHGASVSVVLDVDMSYRPLGGALHLGVRRSPLRTPDQVLALARRARATNGVAVRGVLAYEAQIAGQPDRPASSRLEAALGRVMKRRSRVEVALRRAAVVRALRAEGFDLSVVNGGGTGSLHSTAAEDVVTEVTAGSGLFAPHLFDRYDGLALQPAAYFALQVSRSSDAGVVTCHGGGYVASGRAARDRLPLPVSPPGLALLPLEGAGEVQTPLAVASGYPPPRQGDVVLFRHAKAGELCERFSELLLVEDGRIVGRVPTYRGEGASFG